MSRIARMIEGGIVYNHPSVRAAIQDEEFAMRVRMLVRPEDVDRWVALAGEWVDCYYRHGTTTKQPNSAWVERGRTTFLNHLARGTDYKTVERILATMVANGPTPSVG